MKYAIYILVGVAVVAGIASTFFGSGETQVACTMDAMLCPDGSYVGRTGPSCEFRCPPAPTVPEAVAAHIESKADRIILTAPQPEMVVANPMTLSGEARGPWYSESSFSVLLTDWDGKIISQTVATAQGEWMTEDFVPFLGELDFVSPYKEGDPDAMKRGTLILKKDNALGLPEHDDALEIPVRFAP